jgi:hypothetical protein
VNETGLLRPIETVPEPVSVERNIGTTAVAVVFETVVFAVVEMRVGLPWLAGFDHSTCAVVPTPPNWVPLNVTTVPAHPSLGLTDVSCQADAAWALAKRAKRPRDEARRAVRVSGRRLVARLFGVRAPSPRRALGALMLISLMSLIA